MQFVGYDETDQEVYVGDFVAYLNYGVFEIVEVAGGYNNTRSVGSICIKPGSVSYILEGSRMGWTFPTVKGKKGLGMRLFARGERIPYFFYIHTILAPVFMASKV
jgi:hypothetical protein